jgi:membrane-associated phospholipid phosphatase
LSTRKIIIRTTGSLALLIAAAGIPVLGQSSKTPSPTPTLATSGSSSPYASDALDQANKNLPDDPGAPAPTQSASQPEQHGLIVRSVIRGLNDQKELYEAPFKPSNFKWDIFMLASTGALIATDARISRALPNSHLTFSRQLSNVLIVGMGSSLGGLWAYGIKTDNAHAKETGGLELEALANTFLIYTPMQFLAGRERPTEGHGNGRFWQSNGFNTSFPAGHAMFTWTMASVAAHEYPKPWVQAVLYGAATSVSLGRFFAKQHYASDTLVGSALGYFIGTHIFHAHCVLGLSKACHRPSGDTEQR